MSATVPISVRVDEDLATRLEESENKSQAVRSALRQYYEGDDFELGLSDRESDAYDELLKLTRGGGRVRKDVAETVLAQVVGLEKAIVRHAIFRPLEDIGAIEPRQTWDDVYIRVFPPEEVDVDE